MTGWQAFVDESKEPASRLRGEAVASELYREAV
jgi:hypothetical protein